MVLDHSESETIKIREYLGISDLEKAQKTESPKLLPQFLLEEEGVEANRRTVEPIVPHGKLKFELNIVDYMLPSIFTLENVSFKITQGR